MKSKLILFALCMFILNNLNAQFVQNQFMIGANVPPLLKQDSASFAPADYNGDGKIDFASRINTGPHKGQYQIDYYSTGTWFLQQGWDYKSTTTIYGDTNDILVPGKYHTGTDSIADIAIYNKVTKKWSIDYQANGFGSFDVVYDYSTFPDIDATAIPVPADYDGDKKMDISFKNSAGKWIIDSSSNGYRNATLDLIKTGYGNSTEHPVPADYDGDGKADLSVKTDAGVWKIDYHADGFNGWNATINNCGDQTAHPVPADYNGDGKADLSVKTDAGAWKVTYSFTSGANVIWITGTLGNYYDGANALPFPADYNGDHKADFGFVFSNDGRIYIDNYAAATSGYDYISYVGKMADDFKLTELNPTDVTNYTKLKIVISI